MKPQKEIISIDISQALKDKILAMFSQPVDLTGNNHQGISKGNLYLMFENDIIIYYIVWQPVCDNLYKVLKATTYYELASHNDLITTIDDTTYAIEPWNFFYLNEKEIKDSILIGTLNADDIATIQAYLDGTIKALPKRGLTPISEASIQSKFHEKEAELVRPYAFRLLEDLLL